MLKLRTIVCGVASMALFAADAEEGDIRGELLGKLVEAGLVSHLAAGQTCEHEHAAEMNDALYRAIARDLADIQGVEISLNDSKVRAVGEIISSDDWALYRRVVARYSQNIADYVVFRPGVKLMNDFKGQLIGAGYEIVDEASSDKPGAIAFSYSAGILTLTGYFLSQADADTAKGIVSSQPWLTIEKEAPDGSVPCLLRFTVVDRLIDVGVVFVEVDKNTAESYGNMIADGRILDFEILGRLSRAVWSFTPEEPGNGAGYARVSSDINGVIEAVASDGALVTRMSGHATFNSNSGDQRSKFRNGGKVLLKIPGQLSGGDIKEVEYGFKIDCNCRYVCRDELSLDLKLEHSDMPQRNDSSNDYAQRQIELDSRIVCRVGETVILAGSHELSDDVQGPSGFAFLRKIPVLGWFFSGGSESRDDKHLLILVSPTYLDKSPALVTKPSDENSDLEASASKHLSEEVDGKLGGSRWYHVFYFWKWI